LLTHPTLDLLSDLGLHGMAKGFRDLADNPEGAALGHAEWLGILLERESTLGHVRQRGGNCLQVEVAAVHAASVAIWDGKTSTSAGVSSAMASVCM
jgi:hypothetical protein